MSQSLANYMPINLYTGVPQSDQLQVYTAPSSVVITQAILNNPSDVGGSLTLTVGTQDIACFKLDADETKIITELFIVLKTNDAIALKQSEGGEISVSLNGSIA